MTREYDGYSLFDDIENPLLQGWNRSVVIFNMVEDLQEAGHAQHNILPHVTADFKLLKTKEEISIMLSASHAIKAGKKYDAWRAENE